MSRFVILSLTLVALINSSNIPKTAATPPSRYQNYKTFIKTACNSTTYPTMCYNSLSSYSSTIKADPIKLRTTSLNVNLKYAKNATLLVSNLLKKAKSTSSPEVPVLKDCVEEMKDTVDELKQAMVELKNLNGGGISNAALTDDTTCTDELEEEEVNEETKKKVEKAVSELSKTTSNTLALITNYLRF
ncbi:hypothetical protein N665_0733s0013 [Sinapis alba]|nr:hypothetical protein N665_0733s0013 [Sinapis alba]